MNVSVYLTKRWICVSKFSIISSWIVYCGCSGQIRRPLALCWPVLVLNEWTSSSQP